MTNGRHASAGCRVAALMIALFLSMSLLPAAAAQPADQLAISLSWTTAEGEVFRQEALPILFEGFVNAYWLYLPPEALQQSASAVLDWSDASGRYPGGFSPAGGQLLSQLQYMNAGISPAGAAPIEILALGSLGETLDIYQLFLSEDAPEPEPPAEEVPPASVLVRYLDQDGGEAAPSRTITLKAGENWVVPEPEGLPEGYELLSPSSQLVRVDLQGAVPAEIIFMYRRPEPTAAPAAAADVPVYYRDEFGQVVATGAPVRCEPGEITVIRANPEALPPGCLLTGPDTVEVFVDGSGATPPEAVFACRCAAPTAAPAAAVDVPVYYVDENGQVIARGEPVRCEPGETTVIRADPEALPPDYLLTGPDSLEVQVDGGGAAPPEAVFTCRYAAPTAAPPAVAAVEVPVHYVDENNAAVATPDTARCEPWMVTLVTATPRDLPEGYALIGPDSQEVYVDQDGAHPGWIVFRYRYEAPVTAQPVIPEETPAPTPPLPEGTTAPTAAPPAVAAVEVPVHYVDESNVPVAPPDAVRCEPWEVTPVSASPRELADGYVLAGPDIQEVYVDQDGAHPARIVFSYRYEAPVTAQPAIPQETPGPAPAPTAAPAAAEAVEVIVYYLDEYDAPVAPPDAVRCEPWEVTPVTASPLGLPEGYMLAGPAVQEVYVDQDGAHPDRLVFIYSYEGPGGARTEVPQQTPAAGGSPSNLWAEVSAKSVNFRKAASTASDKLGTFPNGHRFWILEQITAGGDAWYRAMTEGQEGYVMAQYLRLYTREESEEVQIALPSPAPDWGAAPFPEGGPEAQPAPPAEGLPINLWAEVSAKSVNFRKSATIASEKLGTFPNGHKFWILERETADGAEWYRAMTEGQEGYVMAQYLRLYSQEESDLYQQALPTPAAPLPTPVPSPAPTPVQTPAATPEKTPEATPTEIPVSAPVEVIIHYIDETGERVASPTTQMCVDGTNSVTASPADLMEGYTITGDPVQYVMVSNDRAEPEAVTFVYAYTGPSPAPVATETPAPAPRVAIVQVFYRDQHGVTLYSDSVTCIENENNIIHVNPNLLTQADAARYVLNDVQMKTVTVDAQGIATPSEVVFLFNDTKPSFTKEIIVHYRLETGETAAPSGTEACSLGGNDIYAKPADLPDTYLLISQNPQRATLAEDGTLTPGEIVFFYRAAEPQPTAPPEETPLPYPLTSMDAYAYPRSDRINFRSSPLITEGNVIATVGKADLAHITGSYVDSRDELWYFAYADSVGLHGFLKASVLRLLTQNEVAALLGFTPSPSPAPTPQPTAVPDGWIIDRWAETTEASVNFRTSPSASGSGNRIGALQKGTRLWVFTGLSAEEKNWYFVRVNGRDGYVVADYVGLYTQEESDVYQGRLETPMPLQTTGPGATLPPSQTPGAAGTPFPAVTDFLTAAPTGSPAPYQGYALTLQQVALRSGISEDDETILTALPVNTLVYLWGQTYVGGVVWDSADAIAIARSGFLPDSALRRISVEEAQYYLNQLKPQVTATPSPTVPSQSVSGYAITLGDYVPMRSYYDTNAEIAAVLPVSTVVSVLGQEYRQQETWHVVQYAGRYGFIRADQLRMLSQAEEANYLESLRTPTPSPQPASTPAPLTGDSPSSYGYVNTDNVRLRKEPGTDKATLKMMNANAFALVLSSLQQDGTAWYHINQGGTEGYVMGTYFTVLPLGQLTAFLQSDAYLSANVQTQTGAAGPAEITSVEDFNAGVWQNPALAQVSYEPFNPLGTPTPAIEAIYTPQPSPTPTPEPLPSFAPVSTPGSETRDSSFPTVWVSLGIVAVLGGGGFYAYHMYRENQKRAAQRAAQRRQQQAQQMGRSASGQPYARPAQPAASSPYEPPRPPAPRQGTLPYQPARGAQPQGTAAWRPPQTASGQPEAPFPPLSGDTRGAAPERATGPYPGAGTHPVLAPAAEEARGAVNDKAGTAAAGKQAPSQAPEGRRRRADRHTKT